MEERREKISNFISRYKYQCQCIMEKNISLMHLCVHFESHSTIADWARGYSRLDAV